MAEVEAVGLAAGQDLEPDRQPEVVGFGQQGFQDGGAEAAVVMTLLQVEGVELDLLGADAEANAARELLADQDQPQARLVEVLAEDARAREGL